MTARGEGRFASTKRKDRDAPKKKSLSMELSSRRAEGPSVRPPGQRRPDVCHATEPASSPLVEANPRLEARTSKMVRMSWFFLAC